MKKLFAGLLFVPACSVQPDPREGRPPLVYEETAPQRYRTPLGIMTKAEYQEELRRRRRADEHAQEAQKKKAATPPVPYVPDPVGGGDSVTAPRKLGS